MKSISRLKDNAVRESGMPPLEYWQTFFNARLLLAELELDSSSHAIELGAGYGLFTFPLAERCERLTTFEIDPVLCDALRDECLTRRTENINIVQGDFFDGRLLRSLGPFDAAVLFNIVHMENPPAMIRELKTAMQADGLVYLLHWRTDIDTPRGPSLAIRSTPEQCRNWFSECGFRCLRELLPLSAPFHFAQIFSIRGEVS